MDRYWLDDGKVLVTYDLASFSQAEQEIDPAVVTCVRIGAKLYNELPPTSLFQRLKRFNNLHTVVLSDDWIGNDDMPTVRQSFESQFPGLTFSWKSEGLVAGKHGR